MAEKTGSFLEKLCISVTLAFAGVILLQTALVGLTGGKYTAAFLLGLVGTGVLVWLGTKLPEPGRAFPAALFALRFLIALAVILTVQTQPVQDFNTMYEAAQQMAVGSREYLYPQTSYAGAYAVASDVTARYFYDWAYQTGFAAYEAALLAVFGPAQRSLQIANALWMAGTGCLVYGIAERFLSKKAAMAVSLLYALYPGPYLLAGVLTNQHIAALFYYLAVYLLVQKEKLSCPRAVLAGAAIAVGNIMRPIGVVVLLAILCWGVVRIFSGKEKRMRGVLLLAAVLVSFFVVFKAADLAVSLSGLNPEGLANNRPMWKFLLGLNSASTGQWNRTDYDRFFVYPLESDEAMLDAVLDRMGKGPGEYLRLFWGKLRILISQQDAAYWGFGHLKGTAVNAFLVALTYLDRGLVFTVFLLVAAALVLYLKKGMEESKLSLLLGFLFCGYLSVHLIIEVQVRYRYFIMPVVFLLAGMAVEYLLQKKKALSGEKAFSADSEGS